MANKYNTPNYRALVSRMRTLPMLKALVPLVAGVLLADGFVLPLWFFGICFAVCGVMAAISAKGRSAYIAALLLTVGAAAGELSRQTWDFPYAAKAEYRVVLSETPYIRNGHMVAEADISAWRSSDSSLWHPVAAKVRITGDSVLMFDRADIIVCRAVLYPFGGDYGRLMENRGYAGIMRLRLSDVIPCGRECPTGMASLSVYLREGASRKLGMLGLGVDELSVCRAMTAGDRSGITSELRAAYSRSGTSHLLAVSGLHVGIVFMLSNLVLWWLPLLRRGHIYRNVAVILLVWIYALTAGLSPSVVRSALMFSALQFALADTAGYRSLNILAATAFVMLVWDARWLYDPSFQLSFLAVAGIIIWGVPLCRALRSKYVFVNAVTVLIVVGLTATLATAPLVSHLFGIVPLAGAAVGPVVILLANVIVASSVVWIVLPLPFLAPVIRTLLNFAAGAQNIVAAGISQLSWAAAEVRLSLGQTVAIYAVMIAATLVAWSMEKKKSVTLPPNTPTVR